jgi:hypothetical protein
MTSPSLPSITPRNDGGYTITCGTVVIQVFSHNHMFIVGAVPDSPGECSTTIKPVEPWHF